MRNLKKVLSLVLALMMVLSMMVTANAAFTDGADINANYTEAVEVMNAIGILQGNNGVFNPKGTLGRDEAAVILSKAHSGKSAVSYFQAQAKYTENPFADVDGWETPYVLYCYQNDITGGKGANYGVDDNLTGYEFAKMLLVAAGYGKHADYVSDANQTWQQKVLAKAKTVGLLAGLDIVLKNDITREQASQMALNAMKAGGKVTTTYYVVAAADTTEANTKPETYFNVTADAMEAYFMATIMGENVAKVHQVTKTTGGLLADKFGVSYDDDTVDTFGRPAVSYTIPAAITGTVAKTMYYSVATLATYTTGVLPTTVAADLAGYSCGAYTVNWDTTLLPVSYDVAVVVDGTPTTASALLELPTVPVNFATLVYALSDDNQSLEIYGNPVTKTISKIVIAGNYVDEIDTVTEAVALTKTPSYATITDGTFVNLDGYKKGDVVSYNIDATGVVNVAPATGAFQGVVSSYTDMGSYNVYTINGADYYMYGHADESLAQTYLYLGLPVIFYPGAEGTILYIDTIEQAEVIINDYAIVLDTYVTEVPGTGILGKPSYKAEVQVLLSNGKCEIWNLPLNQNAAGAWRYRLNSVNVSMGIDVDGNDYSANMLDAVLGGDRVYTYADKTLVADVATSLTAAQIAAKADGTIFYKVTDTFDYDANYKLGSAYVNENTVFVMKASNYATSGKYVVKTGLKALTEDLTGTKYVVASMVWSAAANAYVETAVLVFAADTTAANAVGVTDTVVYNTGIYTVTYDSSYQPVYTYTVVDAAGNYSTAKGTASDAAGLWTLKADGSLNTAVPGASVKAITAINGSVVDYGTGYTIVGSSTAVHSVYLKTLKVGAYIWIVDANADNIAEVIYIVG